MKIRDYIHTEVFASRAAKHGALVSLIHRVYMEGCVRQSPPPERTITK